MRHSSDTHVPCSLLKVKKVFTHSLLIEKKETERNRRIETDEQICGANKEMGTKKQYRKIC
jgi:hypothetical protein